MKQLTTGEIAKQLKIDRDVVSYTLRKLKIEPESRAGQVRIFSKSTMAKVKEFLERKDSTNVS